MHRDPDAPATADPATAAAAPTAYGLALPDLAGAAHLLRPARGGETTWRVHRRVAGPGEQDGAPPTGGPPPDGHDEAAGHTAHLDAERARLGVPGGGSVLVDRASRTTTFTTPHPLSDAEVVHPHLASTAVTVAHWRGRLALHAAAVVAGGRAWALLGERGAGKSTALYSLVRAGLVPVTDDVLVLDGARVLPGPRCVDLRLPSAEHFGAGDDLGVVGRRRRWRVALEQDAGDLPDDVELGGFVHLAWGQSTAVDTVPAQHRLPALLDALALRLPPADQVGLLRLLALPTVRLTRPRRLEDAERVADALAAHLTRLSASAPPPRPTTPAAAG
ncbi:hypothetical protein [Kineococcus sp. G2]|uniref:hypothetical protein n=1 Tax=Kineococcus sp. G2 TaxID=3127484 RepID=UPI00301D0D17